MWSIANLEGVVKHYDWGGMQYIPALLCVENPQHQPFAEYWMGAHTQANCMVRTDKDLGTLISLISQQPTEMLGEKVNETFGALPYLFKVLDVKQMLSIQVHPSKRAAEVDFVRENLAGVPLNAAHRNYKDTNHKPEIMVALSDFYLLHGFKPTDEMKAILASVKELHFLQSVFETQGYTGLYKLVMEMPQEEVNEILQPLLERIIPLYETHQLEKGQEDFWAARAALTFNRPGVIDKGIFSIYFFNILNVAKGEAVFQDAGVPHAYLEGQNVELMANSDNVLRGGLTTKHIDVKELLKHTKCEATIPNIFKVTDALHQTYKTPAQDFELSSYPLKTGETIALTATSLEIVLLTNGAVNIKNKEEQVHLSKGHISAVIKAGTNFEITALEDSTVFKAGVPNYSFG